jgi:uncharacterized lipoprotein YddW (UPF0748 family)
MAHVEETMVRHGLTRRVVLARLGALAAAGISGCTAPVRVDSQPPPAPREFRGAWIASVSNIDWPSRPALSTEAQQDEIRNLVRVAQRCGLNALIVQVRPAADALYESKLEPWSEYLTGEQGRPPEPRYDPLAFWIDEAHRAGMELHAWFNPYRVRHSSARGPLAPRHVASTHPASVRAYGDMLWMDPGDPLSAERALSAILDVVRRYDIDGVHVDDYFYPYPVKGAGADDLPFPDDATFAAYALSGGSLSRADWRRANVDGFIERLYAEVRRMSDRVRVGISPFGVGRPDRRPPGVTGFSQYDAIYADVERWLENGWMDYLAPQLYGKADTPGQPFASLLEYWQAQNRLGRHIWPGLFTSRIDASEQSWSPDDIATEVELARARGATGQIHFSIAALAQDRRGIAQRLHSLYAVPALVPATPWLARGEPASPMLNARSDANFIRLSPANGDAPWLVAAWALYGDSWRFFVLPRGTGAVPREDTARPIRTLVVTAVDRLGMESARQSVGLA